ncbi:MAG TPA: lysophospholipid acyltransferase family protein [Candidatus Saccharimonadia bacterium]|nr:lysophospholipid acyltransferase family protein [Candidatus Saccharimonadia bacterium]
MSATQVKSFASLDSLLSPGRLRVILLSQRVLYWPIRLITHLLPHRTRVNLQPGDISPDHCYIVAANHQSMFDPFIICVALPPGILAGLAPLRFFAHNALFDKFLRHFLFAFGAFPASANASYIYGLTAAQLFLKHHQSIMIFPEGKRTPHKIRPRSGIEVLAKTPQVKIIPVHIEWCRGRWLWPSYAITVGKPLEAAEKLTALQILNRIYRLPIE